MSVIQIRREQLLKPLNAVVGVVERKHTLPILSNLLVESGGGKVSLIGTDLELQISANLAEGAMSEASFTVSARKLLDISRSLPAETLMDLDLDGETLKIKAGKSRFTLQTLPARDFPQMQLAEDEGLQFSISADSLRHLLMRVQYAMAVQDIRYYLNGMLLSVNKGMLTVAATDGHRLAVDAIPMPLENPTDLDVILPRKAVLELVKLLGDNLDPVEVHMSAAQVVFKQAGFELRSKVVDGKFPDYQRVVPVGYNKNVFIGRQLFNQSLARAAILTNEKYRGIRMALAENKLRIACRNNEQEEAQEELDIDYTQEPMDIGFNVQYLLDILNNLDCETVQCSLNDPTSSLLISIPGEEHFRYVVMPMRI